MRAGNKNGSGIGKPDIGSPGISNPDISNPGINKPGISNPDIGRHDISSPCKTGFFERVYEIVAKIPKGKVATYGQIAVMLGEPRKAKIVGWAFIPIRTAVKSLVTVLSTGSASAADHTHLGALMSKEASLKMKALNLIGTEGWTSRGFCGMNNFPRR